MDGSEFDLDKLARRVQFIRVERGWNQSDLAERAGITQAQVSQLENKRFVNPPINLLFRVADAAGVSRSFIMLLTDDPTGIIASDVDLTREELRWLRSLRVLSSRDRSLLAAIVDAMQESDPLRTAPLYVPNLSARRDGS